MTMNCTLCHQPIKDYDTSFNHLTIDDAHSADFCQSCLDKIIKWQQGVFTKLFPTTALKKRFGNR